MSASRIVTICIFSMVMGSSYAQDKKIPFTTKFVGFHGDLKESAVVVEPPPKVSPVNDCSKFAGIGFESQYDECLKAKLAHVDPLLVNACNSVKASNPDRYRLCLAKIASNESVEHCKVTRTSQPRQAAACLSFRNNGILDSKIFPEDKSITAQNVTKEMPHDMEVQFNTMLLAAKGPDKALLDQCTLHMRAGSYLSESVNGGNFFRSSDGSGIKTDSPHQLGTYYKVGDDAYFFSEEAILDEVGQRCANKTYCVFESPIGNMFQKSKVFITTSSMKDPKTGKVKRTIQFSGNDLRVEPYKVQDSIHPFKPEKVKSKNRDYVNAQMARAAVIAVTDEVFYYREKHKEALANAAAGKPVGMTEEAYKQSRDVLNGCAALIKQMAPGDSKILSDLDGILANPGNKELYDLGKKGQPSPVTPASGTKSANK